VFTARILNSVTDFDRLKWDRLFPGRVEGWDYFRACEAAAPQGFELGALGVFRENDLVGAAPTFKVNYRLDMSLPQRFQAAGEWLNARAPRLVNAPVVGLGSPLGEECPIGIEAALVAEDRSAVFEAMISALTQHAKATNSALLALKDMTERDRVWAGPVMARAGFAAVPTLPVAIVHLPFTDESAYIASLAGPMRNEIRRKLKHLKNVEVTFPATIDGLEDEIVALFEETKSHRKADYDDFDNVPPRYFRAVLEALGPRARLMVCRIGGVLASFNIFLIEDDRIIGKYLGMRYPLAREHNLYFLNWMLVARVCMAEGKSWMQTGHTGYRVKVRLGSKLKRSWVYFRHVNPVINVGFRTFGPRFAFDAMDPDLKELGERAPYLPAPDTKTGLEGSSRRDVADGGVPAL
jgi:hypothetical protein